MPRLKWLMFQMPMSSPQRMRILGLSVFAICSLLLNCRVLQLQVRAARRLAEGSSTHSGSLVRCRWSVRSWRVPVVSAVALANLAAKDPVDADRVGGDDGQDHDTAVEQESQ